MEKDLKEAIKECITTVNSLSEDVDKVYERAISELPKEKTNVFLYLMDLKNALRQSKGIAERLGWHLNK